jgi:phage terminase small subunit
MKMTPRKATFITEYSLHGNGTQAAVKAGVPESSAHVTASRWLKEPKIAAAIDEQKERLKAKLELTAERVLLELMRIAYYDPAKLYDEHGERIPVHLLDEDTRRAVASIEDETRKASGTTTRSQYVKMADKKGAAELLGKYLKLFTERVEHDGRVTLETLICGSKVDRAGDPEGS